MTAALLLWLASASLAAEPAVEVEVPRVSGEERIHISILSGPSIRSSRAETGQPPRVNYDGAVPPGVQLSITTWFLDWFGLSGDASGEWFSVQDAPGSPNRAQVAAYRGQLALAGRFMPILGLSLEARLGYALGLLPTVQYDAGAVVNAPMLHHGPMLAAAVGLDRGWPISARLRATVAPLGWGNSQPSGDAAVGWYQVGAEVGVGRLAALGAVWSAVVDYELGIAAASNARTSYSLEQMSHRFGIGIRARVFPAGARGPRAAATLTGALLGSVTTPEGQPIPDAQVQVEDKVLATDAQGKFKLEGLAPRSWNVSATAADFKPASAAVEVKGGAEATVQLVLPRPNGPGVISGSVRFKEPDGPAADAEVRIPGLPPVRTAADGTYRLERAGPGGVAVTVTYPGYLPVEEAVQVPPEGNATLDVMLANKRPMAKLRGRVTATDPSFKATVTVVEAKQKIAVSGDGRFALELPGGSYKVVVEAPGYLSQSRTVNLADGDQTIYYFELRPSQ